MASQRSNRANTTTKYLPDFISYIFIGSCVLIIPFLFSRQTVDPSLSLRFIALSISLLLIIILLASAILKRTISLDYSIFLRMIFPISILYIVFSALSLFQAINIQEGIFELLKVCLSFFFFIAAVIILQHSRRGILHLTKSAILVSIVLGFIGICQYYGLAFNSIPGNFVIYGTMVNKNLFASFLFLTLPFPLYGFFYLKNPWDALSAFALFLSTACIMLAASRAVWLALFISFTGTGIVGWFSLRRFSISKRDARQLVIRLIILVILFLALGAFGYFSKSRLTQQPSKNEVVSAADSGESSVQVRLKMWNKTLQMIADDPVFGVGLGNWKLIIPRYGTNGMPSENGKVQYLRPHNDFLWVAAETGLLGFMSYLAIFGVFFYYLFRGLKYASDIKSSMLLLTLAFGLIGFLVISNFSFPKERISHLIVINIILATILIKYHRASAKRKTGPVSVIPVLIISLSILTATTLLGYDRLRSEIHSKKAYGYWQKEQWDRMLREAEAASSNWVNMDPVATPFPWYEGLANISMNKKEEALKSLTKAQQVHPYQIQVLDNLATCYELLGDHSNAIKYYQKVLEISPRFENSLRNLSVVYHKMGDYREAIRTYSQANLSSQNQTLFKYLETYQNEIEKRKQ